MLLIDNTAIMIFRRASFSSYIRQPHHFQLLKTKTKSAELVLCILEKAVSTWLLNLKEMILGSLEALLEFLKQSQIPYSGINIGPVHKKDVMKATTMLEHNELYGVILGNDSCSTS